MTVHNYRIHNKVDAGQAENFEIELSGGAASIPQHASDPDSQFARMRAMWRHALIEQVRVAEGRMTGINMAPQARAAEISRARSLFEDGGRDFRFLCEMAGFEPSLVQRAWLEGRLCADALIFNRRAMA